MRWRSEAWWFVLLALALRLWNLASGSVWLDEAYSVFLARQQIPEMVETIWAGDVHAPLFYMGLRGWLQIVPATPFWLRLPQALVGAAGVGLLYLVARRLSGPRAARCCALLAATSHYLWLFDQECRMYPWVGFASCLYWWSLLRLKDGAARGWSAVTIGAAWLGALCDYRFGLFLLCAGLPFLWTTSRRALIFGTLAVGALGCLPLLPLMRHQMSDAGAGARLALCNDPLSPESLARLLPALSGAWYLELPAAANYALSALLVALLAWGCRRPGVLLAVISGLGPLAIILAYSALRGSIFSVHSSYVLAYPLLLWLGITTAALPRCAAAAILTVWIALNLTMMAWTHATPELAKQRWLEAATLLRNQVQPGDVVVVLPAFQARPLLYYHRPLRILELNPVDLTDRALTSELKKTRRTWWVLAGDAVVDRRGFSRAWLFENLRVLSSVELRNGPFHEINGRGTSIHLAVPR